MRSPSRPLAVLALGTTLILVVAAVLVACTSPGPSATPLPTSPSPSATPSAASGVVLAGVPTACIGLGDEDCTRVVAMVATLLDPADPAVRYIQVGPFGCLDGQRCPTTLAARPEGDISLESADGALSFHGTARGGVPQAVPQEVFGVSLPPTSAAPIPAGPQPFTLGHCGLWSGIDVGASWWDPVGVIDYDHPDAINAAEGTFARLDPDRAVFTSHGGLTVQLIRRNGPKFLPFCD
jgi:hypothetical protein